MPLQHTFLSKQMPLAGLEPARSYPLDFESSASANSATAALCSVFTEHANHTIHVYITQDFFTFFPTLFSGRLLPTELLNEGCFLSLHQEDDTYVMSELYQQIIPIL